jgi:hypothetical protein
MIKALPLDSQELEIWRYLNSPKLRADKRNRTIPLLDIFRSDDTVFVVMPEWTYVSSLPSCLNVREHLDDAVQYIEVCRSDFRQDWSIRRSGPKHDVDTYPVIGSPIYA